MLPRPWRNFSLAVLIVSCCSVAPGVSYPNGAGGCAEPGSPAVSGSHLTPRGSAPAVGRNRGWLEDGNFTVALSDEPTLQLSSNGTFLPSARVNGTILLQSNQSYLLNPGWRYNVTLAAATTTTTRRFRGVLFRLSHSFSPTNITFLRVPEGDATLKVMNNCSNGNAITHTNSEWKQTSSVELYYTKLRSDVILDVDVVVENSYNRSEWYHSSYQLSFADSGIDIDMDGNSNITANNNNDTFPASLFHESMPHRVFKLPFFLIGVLLLAISVNMTQRIFQEAQEGQREDYVNLELTLHPEGEDEYQNNNNNNVNNHNHRTDTTNSLQELSASSPILLS